MPREDQGMRSGGCVVLACLLFGVMPRFAFSAEGADTFNPEKPARPEYLPSKPTDDFQLPPVAPSTKVPSAVTPFESRRINRVVFKGNTVIRTGELDAITQPYLRRPIGISEIEELRQKLTRYYVDLGYINSGALLALDPNEGDVLVCEIVEGRLAGIRLRGLARLNEDYVAYRLARDSDGPLNVDTLRERFQLLLSDPLFARMNARLMPGSRPGEAILDVDIVRARPYQLTLFADNYRPPSIGSEAVGLSGWIRNVTGHGDVVDASIQDSARWDSGLRGSVGFRMPISRYGTGLSLQYERGRSSVVEEPLTILGIRSRLESRDIGANQTFIETLRDKFTVGLNYVERENRTWLLGTPFSFLPGEPDGVTKTTGWRFWQEYSHRSEAQVLALRSTFSTVRNNLQEIPELPPTTQPDRKYSLWLGQAQFARQILENGAQFIVRGTVQRTRQTLLTLDGMPIGGVTTVRGYRENQLIRDNVEILNAEVEYPVIGNAAERIHMTVSPFYDYGRGKNRDAPSATLSSWGLATRIRWLGVSLYAAAAKRLVHPESVNGSKGNLQDKGIHFYIAYDFY
jgi:hemolysin activation/secretion protein